MLTGMVIAVPSPVPLDYLSHFVPFATVARLIPQQNYTNLGSQFSVPLWTVIIGLLQATLPAVLGHKWDVKL